MSVPNLDKNEGLYQEWLSKSMIRINNLHPLMGATKTEKKKMEGQINFYFTDVSVIFGGGEASLFSLGWFLNYK